MENDDNGCHDCGHLKAVISWWCGSKEAIREHGTAMPMVKFSQAHCAHWVPMPKTLLDRAKENTMRRTKSERRARARRFFKILLNIISIGIVPIMSRRGAKAQRVAGVISNVSKGVSDGIDE